MSESIVRLECMSEVKFDSTEDTRATEFREETISVRRPSKRIAVKESDFQDDRIPGRSGLSASSRLRSIRPLLSLSHVVEMSRHPLSLRTIAARLNC